MNIPADTLAAWVDATRRSAAALACTAADVGQLSDVDLVAAQSALAEVRREVDVSASLIAGEIASRSDRSLGYAGLAQREGFRTPEALVRHATGSSARDASTLVRVGSLVRDSLLAEGCGTWADEIGRAVACGSIGVDAARVIHAGLGEPSLERGVTEAHLADASRRLLAEASGADVDQLARRARDARDDLDAAGVADHERVLHDERSIRRMRRANGLSRYIVDPDLESSVLWDDLYDCLTSPRRGGPRFVTAEGKDRARDIATDNRTLEQYVHDSITELLRISATADSADRRRIVGSRAPAVRVLVAAPMLSAPGDAQRRGFGRIEGHDTPISLETVERLACSNGTIAIHVGEHGQVLNLGREQRLFSARQKLALAARDGGCRLDGCDRPPSWTEAHHIRHWLRDDGETNIVDGILLCRYHHLLVHNNHWEIERREDEYWLFPPPEVDPSRTPRLMPSTSAALRDLQRLVRSG